MVVRRLIDFFPVKAAEPKAPLWIFIAASQFMDWGWSCLVLSGVEHFRMDPALPGSPLDLYDMPWTHSVPGALGLSVLGAAIARFGFKLENRVAALVGAVVFSHWMLDLLVHRPDLALYPGGPKVGLGLWNHPVPEMIVEMGLVAVAGALWAAQRVSSGQKAGAAAWFLAGLAAIQYISVSMPGGGTPASMAASALAVYLVVTGWAFAIDRGR